jgi:hypothetical protein
VRLILWPAEVNSSARRHAMRIMIKFRISVETGNSAVRSGKVEQVF